MSQESSAFPVPKDACAAGVSHLQWLAGLAMQSYIMRLRGVPDSESEREEVALWSYRMAQAMKKMESRIQIQEAESPS